MSDTPRSPRFSDEEVDSRARLAAEMIGDWYQDADEAFESLVNSLGDEPNFAVADWAFADATGTLDQYIGPNPNLPV